MARIRLNDIEKIEKDRIMVHNPVSATYSVFENAGKKYVQIDTYGNENRKNKGMVSQSIQFDRESAVYLVKLLANEFEISLTIN